MPKFKPGDIVICVEAGDKRSINVPCIYTVKENKNDIKPLISLVEIDNTLFYYEDRFRLIKSA